jgi:signal transduction histidine kinase
MRPDVRTGGKDARSGMRLRPASIRVRDTIIATVLSGLVLTMIAIGVDLTVRHAVRESVWHDAMEAARRVSALVEDHKPINPLTADATIPLIQVVNSRGKVIHASPAALRMGPLSTVRPSSPDGDLELTSCPPRGDGCLLIEAIRVNAGTETVVVYAGRSEPAILRGHWFEVVLGAMVALLTALTALATWFMVGRTLRPTSAICAHLADITINDLSRRVPVPKGENEITRLAHTVNETLDRLEYSAEQQRRFSSDASHELRTPIAGLRNQIEAALMYPDDTEMEHTLRSMLRDTERLEDIIADLLLLARLGTGSAMVTQPVDLAQLVTAEVGRRSGPIRMRLTPGLVVNGISMQLTRLLANLLDNAERYCENAIDVELTRDEGIAVLSVTDDGPGIAPEDRDKVFDRFTRLDTARSRDQGGTGLGLPIAHNIAVAHGGTLRIEDSKQGARFVLRLPLA